MTDDISIGKFDDGTAAGLDLDRLVGSHLCIQGNSGAGKSGAIRRLLEVTHGRLQHIILDVEDEFYTLREKFEYMIAGGDNGDCVANVNNAAALALMILRTGFSAVVQINNLHIADRREFIAVFLDALIAAPKDLWHPALVVLDEAQMYAPQVGTVDSSDAVVSLMTLGRKRGFTGVLATPRISSISKDATGPVNNWLMGRIGQPADRRTTADALGFRANSEEARGLLKLKTRQFWAFGPALCLEPTLLMIGDAETTVIKAGQAAVPTPPAPAAMRAMLQELNAAAKAVEADQVKDGKESLAAQPNSKADQMTATRAQLDEALATGRTNGYVTGYQNGYVDARTTLCRMFADQVAELADRIRSNEGGSPVAIFVPMETAADQTVGPVAGDFSHVSLRELRNAAAARAAASSVVGEAFGANASEPSRPEPPPEVERTKDLKVQNALGGPISKAMAETLQALAWWNSLGVTAPTKKQLAAMLKIDPGGSTMRARLAELSKADLVEYPQPGSVRLTPAGKKCAPAPDRSQTLIATIRASLSEAELATFNALPRKPGDVISKADLAGKLNVDAGGSTLRARLAALSGRELIEYPKPGLVTRQEWVVEGRP